MNPAGPFSPSWSPGTCRSARPRYPVERGGLVPTRWDALAVLLVLGLVTFLAHTSRELLQPLEALQESQVSLDPAES